MRKKMEKMKKLSKLLFICIISLLLFSGCSDEESSLSNSTDTNVEVEENSDDNSIKSTKDLSSKKGELSCSREATAADGITPAFNYYIKYKNGNILELHAIEMVMSSDQESLDIYEEAYENINKNYEGLKYYDTKVVRDKSSVTRDTVINYDKIDIDALLDLEGEEDNIIEDGKAKLDIWLDFAGKFGTTCVEK